MITDVLSSVNLYILFCVKRFELSHVVDIALQKCYVLLLLLLISFGSVFNQKTGVSFREKKQVNKEVKLAVRKAKKVYKTKSNLAGSSLRTSYLEDNQEHGFYLPLAGAVTSAIFVATNVILSRHEYACHDKTFVATNTCLSSILLSRQKTGVFACIINTFIEPDFYRFGSTPKNRGLYPKNRISFQMQLVVSKQKCIDISFVLVLFTDGFISNTIIKGTMQQEML